MRGTCDANSKQHDALLDTPVSDAEFAEHGAARVAQHGLKKLAVGGRMLLSAGNWRGARANQTLRSRLAAAHCPRTHAKHAKLSRAEQHHSAAGWPGVRRPHEA